METNDEPRAYDFSTVGGDRQSGRYVHWPKGASGSPFLDYARALLDAYAALKAENQVLRELAVGEHYDELCAIRDAIYTGIDRALERTEFRVDMAHLLIRLEKILGPAQGSVRYGGAIPGK